MNISGQILLWAGFLSGSLATVFNIEVAGDKWSTINWWWYGVSVVVGLIGIVMLRGGKKSATAKSDKSHANLKQIKGNLADLTANVDSFHSEVNQMSPRQMIDFIEDTLTDDLRDFADGRDSIAAEHGLQVFADVMTQFAAGERSINRAWCAAADGYIDEAANCVDRARGFFHQAKKQLDAA